MTSLHRLLLLLFSCFNSLKLTKRPCTSSSSFTSSSSSQRELFAGAAFEPHNQSLAGGGENKPIFIQALAQRRNYNSPVEAHGMLFPGGENFTNYSQAVSQPNCCCCSTTKRGRKTMNGIRAVQLRSAHRTRIGCHGGLCALTQRKFYYGWVSGESVGPGAEAFARSLVVVLLLRP